MQTVLAAHIVKGKLVEKYKLSCFDVQNLPQGTTQRFYQTAKQAKLAKVALHYIDRVVTEKKRIRPYMYIFIYHMNIKPIKLPFIQQLLIVKP